MTHLGHKRGDAESTPNSPRSPEVPVPTGVVTPAATEDLRNRVAEQESHVYVAQARADPIGPFSASTTLPGFHPFPTPTCTCVPETNGKDAPGPTESDEALLCIYRTRLTPQFPFVVIPDDVTAVELQRSRPFLAKAIRMVASLRNRRSMWDQSRLLLRQISEAAFMGSGRSLDLLQSIIVYLGFFHYFCFAHGNFSNLSYLASSMIAGMGLDRPRGKPAFKNKGLKGVDPEEPRAMSNDERRAALAVWYLNSRFAIPYPACYPTSPMLSS